VARDQVDPEDVRAFGDDDRIARLEASEDLKVAGHAVVALHDVDGGGVRHPLQARGEIVAVLDGTSAVEDVAELDPRAQTW